MTSISAVLNEMRLKDWLANYLDGVYDGVKKKQIDVAHRLGYENNSVIGMVLAGRKIAPEQFERWADALGLTGENREIFATLAHLDHASPWLRQEYLRFEERLKRVRTELENLNVRAENERSKTTDLVEGLRHLLAKKDELIVKIIREARRRDPHFPDFGFDI